MYICIYIFRSTYVRSFLSLSLSPSVCLPSPNIKRACLLPFEDASVIAVNGDRYCFVNVYLATWCQGRVLPPATQAFMLPIMPQRLCFSQQNLVEDLSRLPKSSQVVVWQVARLLLQQNFIIQSRIIVNRKLEKVGVRELDGRAPQPPRRVHQTCGKRPGMRRIRSCSCRCSGHTSPGAWLDAKEVSQDVARKLSMTSQAGQNIDGRRPIAELHDSCCSLRLEACSWPATQEGLQEF